MSISKHLANEKGAVYRLLAQGNATRIQLEIQRELIAAAPAAAVVIAKGDEGVDAVAQGHGVASVTAAIAAAEPHQQNDWPWSVLEVVMHRGEKMGSINASTALHLLAHGANEDTAIADASSYKATAIRGACHDLTARVVADVATKPRNLSIAAWSLARLAFRDDAPLVALATAVCAVAKDFNSQDAANVAWAYARLKSSQPECQDVLAAIGDRAAEEASIYQSRHIALIAWALASSRLKHQDFYWAVSSTTEASQAAKWSSADLAKLLWSFARVRCDAPPPLEATAARARQFRSELYGLQDVTLLMWAAGTLGATEARPAARMAARQLLDDGATRLRRGGALGLEARHLTSAAWALSRWQRHCRLTGWRQELKSSTCRAALHTLATVVSTRLADFRGDELARFLWALGSQGCLNLSLLAVPLDADLKQRSLSFTATFYTPVPSSGSERNKRGVLLEAEEICTVANALAWTFVHPTYSRRSVNRVR
eukprot:TRINITY_DN75246_c0_g1_i1.p1 TRINITY_DN75246_c0_g1~~TRINITY_DN75246_c0_g1_i1.p1  ORF type:complete len:486 (+),score=61.33 TRINITY_DN75246_c0_g1_i1:157-1614(+)